MRAEAKDSGAPPQLGPGGPDGSVPGPGGAVANPADFSWNGFGPMAEMAESNAQVVFPGFFRPIRREFR